MADQKISQLSSGAPAQAGDEYVVARSGANYKLTLTNIAASMPPIGATTPNTGAFTSLTNGLGAVGTPSYTFTGDLNTGMWSPTADTVAWSTGGSERMRLDTSGNLGIGRAPNYKLDAYISGTGSPAVASSNDNIVTVLQSVGSSQGNVGTITSHPLVLLSGNTERMRIDTSGNVGIGGTAAATTKLDVTGTLPTSGATSVAYRANPTIPSGTTSDYVGYSHFAATQATVFTLTNFYSFTAAGANLAGGATVTNNYGFWVGSGNTFGTNNYGFYSDIASGSNRWNFYAAGTAANYFAGDTGVGSTPAANYRLWVKGSDSTSSNAAIGVVNSSDTNMFYLRNDNYFNSGAINNYSVAGTTVVIDANNFLGKTTSSLRYKKDIVNYDKGLVAISKLRPVYYKSAVEGPNGLDPKQHAGLIAEEIEAEGFEEFLIRDNDGRAESIQYPNMVALLVKAIQELEAKVAALEAK